MTANSDSEGIGGNESLVIMRDMLINDRRCTLRVTVVHNTAGVAFDATDASASTVSTLKGTIALNDLVPVTKAISATLGSAVKALGLAQSRHTAELDEVRHSDPRAGLPWSADEDARLIDRHRAGASLLELSNEFGRNIGGINARLKLHGLRPAPRRDGDHDPNLDYADISDPDPDWS